MWGIDASFRPNSGAEHEHDALPQSADRMGDCGQEHIHESSDVLDARLLGDGEHFMVRFHREETGDAAV